MKNTKLPTCRKLFQEKSFKKMFKVENKKLFLNVRLFLLSLGTVLSGFSILFCGETRIQAKEDQKTVTLCVNVWVGVSQLFTVTFLFVGWFWSLAWGIKLVTLSGEYNVLFDLSNECHKNINISIVVYLWINARCHVNTMAYFGVHKYHCTKWLSKDEWTYC